MPEENNPKELFDDSLIFTPGEFSEAGVSAIKRASNKNLSLPLPLPGLEDYFGPTVGGDLVGVIGQTSHGKSMLLHYAEFEMAKVLSNRGIQGQAIFHISIEESIEAMAIQSLSRHSAKLGRVMPMRELLGGNYDDSSLSYASIEVAGTPIYYIGESSERARRNRKKWVPTDALSAEATYGMVARMCDRMQLEPILVAADYLQAFPIPRGRSSEDRRLQVRDDVYFLRRMGRSMDCTVWTAVQAKQELKGMRLDRDKPGLYIPNDYDGEETSAIGQRFDRLLSTWIPHRTYGAGAAIPLASGTMVVEKDDFIVKVAKQRGGFPSGRLYRYRVNYDAVSFEIREWTDG